jgi:hypothetical protein
MNTAALASSVVGISHALPPDPPSGVATRQAALGLPAGDYRDDAHKPGGRSHTEWSEQAGEAEFGSGETAGRLAWEGNEYSIVVGFDQAGVVRWKNLWKHIPPHAP